MVELAALPTAQMFKLDMCRFGSPHKKPTAVLSNVDLREMALLCDQAERPHLHEPLVGTVLHEGQKVFKTRLAQVYPSALCKVWAQAIAANGMDPLAATFQLVTPAAERKRSVGQEVPYKTHKQRITAEKANSAGYQLKRSALPPLLATEMEPGQAVQAALSVIHPFTMDPALDPDLQEVLNLVSSQPQFVLGHRAGALRFWEARARELLPVTEKWLRQVSDPHLRRLLRGQPDGQPLVLGQFTHVALWQEMLTAARCIDLQLPAALLHGFSIVGAIQRSNRWPALPVHDDGISVQELSDRAWEFFNN